MNVFIPTIGTKFILNQPWTFTLHDEYRNWDFWVASFGEPPKRNDEKYTNSRWGNRWYDRYGSEDSPRKLTLKEGTILSVDRIYIRKGNKNYDSVSFRVLKGSPGPTGRFWAKLNEVNTGLNVSLI